MRYLKEYQDNSSIDVNYLEQIFGEYIEQGAECSPFYSNGRSSWRIEIKYVPQSTETFYYKDFPQIDDIIEKLDRSSLMLKDLKRIVSIVLHECDYIFNFSIVRSLNNYTLVLYFYSQNVSDYFKIKI